MPCPPYCPSSFSVLTYTVLAFLHCVLLLMWNGIVAYVFLWRERCAHTPYLPSCGIFRLALTLLQRKLSLESLGLDAKNRKIFFLFKTWIDHSKSSQRKDARQCFQIWGNTGPDRCKVFGQLFMGLFRIWRHFYPIWANCYTNMQMFIAVNNQILKK